MVSIMSLLLPILISSVIVFIVSSLFHTLSPHHDKDFKVVPDEDKAQAELRKFNMTPGDYFLPYSQDKKERMGQAHKDKVARGPVVIMTVLPPNPLNMVKNLVQWFMYLLIVSIFTAYITGRALPVGANYLQVFRFAGASAFMGYSLALMQDSIWFGKSWTTTIKNIIDGLVFALLTAGVFGWLWPQV